MRTTFEFGTPFAMRTMAALFLLTATACPRGTSTTGAAESIEDLRARAEARPGDADAAQAVALGELLREDGDPLRAEAALGRALALRPNAILELFAASNVIFTENPARPWTIWSPRRSGPQRRAMVYWRRWRSAVFASSKPSRPTLPSGSRRACLRLHPSWGRRRGFPPLPSLPNSRSGAGIGPLRRPAPDRRGASTSARGRSDRSARFAGIRRTLPRRRAREPGGPRNRARVASGAIDAGAGLRRQPWGRSDCRGRHHVRVRHRRSSQSGTYTLRLETPNSVELRIDGERVARLDHRRQPLERTTFHRLELTAGEHRIAVKVTTRHPNPILSVALIPGDGDTELREDSGCYLRASAALSRGQTTRARTELASERCEGAPIVLALRSAVALSDPYLPSDMGRDEARRLLRRSKPETSVHGLPVSNWRGSTRRRGETRRPSSPFEPTRTLGPK